MRLIHLTDPHLTSLAGRRPGALCAKRWLSWLSWQARRKARHRPARLAALINALDPPEAWAVTGDLCQTGQAGEIDEAARWLERLADPERVALVPGNHDIFGRDSAPRVQRRWGAYLHLDADWPTLLRIGPVSLIGVNSAVVTPILRASGKVGDSAAARLAERLDAERDRCRVVLIHHPPLPGVCAPRKALHDAGELSAILHQHDPALVLHGHLHRNHEWPLGGNGKVFCTASASAAGRAGAAAAREFRIARGADAGFDIEMRLLALDASNRLHVIDRQQWRTPG